MEYNYVLLDIAKEDLNVSKILYDNSLYPQSIFYLQQSIEKSIKHLGLINEVIKPHELNSKIGHKAYKVFTNQVKQIKHITGDSDEVIDREYNELRQLLRSNDLSLFEKVIKKTITSYRDIKFESELIEELINAIINKENPKLFKRIKKDKPFREFFNTKKERFIEYFPNYLRSVLLLFTMNSVVEEYVTAVRYPNSDKFENPSKIFKPNHPLVVLVPFFIEHTEFALKGLCDFQMMTEF